MAVNWNDFEPIDPATNAAPKRPAAVDWSQFEPIKPNTDGQAVSGFKRSFEEIPGSVAAIGAYGADLVGATGVRDSLLSYAKRRDEEVGARHQNDAASFTDAWDGKVPLPDFLANTGGYVAGQVLQSIATGGLGAIGAKMLAKQVIKELAETTAAKAIAAGASEEAAKKAVTEAVVAAGTKAMTRGAAVGAGAHNFGMELGTIYPAAVEEAGGADNLDGGDKFRVFAAAGLAAGVDTAGEAIMAGRILRGSKAGSKTTGIIGRAAREVPAGMVREGATEAVQTGLEHYGAGQPIADEKGRRDIIDSAATGAFGGGLGGGLAATHRRKVPEAPSPSPITKGLQGIAAATNIEDAIGAAAAAISPQKQAPTPLELATEELRGAGVMDAIRERFGAEGASGLLNSLAQAGNPRATPEVRALHQQVVDEMLFWLRASRDQQAQDQLALPAPGGQPQIGMAPRAPELGMGSTPTGTLRVGPDGVVVPETVADLSQPQVRPDGMTATVPRGGEPGAGVMVGQGTLTPGASIPAARTPLLQRIEDLRRKPESAEPVATAPPPIAPSAAALQTASWAAQQHLAEVNRAIKAGTLPAPVPAPAIEPIAPPPAPNQPAASPGQAEEAQGAGAPIEAEKPRVFRSRANAIAERDRLGNEHKLQKIKGGYILRRKTDAEFAAENAGARRLSSGAASGTRRSLLSTLAAGGGINLSERADTIGEGNRNVGGRMLFTRAGKSIHQWAEALAESGFIPPSEVADDGGVRWLQEAIQNEYSGIREHFAMNDQERMDELARELMGEEPVDPLAPFDDDELGESGYSAASPEVQAVTEAMLADAEASGIDTETIREDAARKTEGQSADAYHEAVQLAVAQALVAHRRAAGEADASAARGSSEDHGEAAGNQGAQEQGLRLEAQTPEDLRAKAEREAAGAEAERANQRELAARAAAETRRKNKAEEDARADRVRKERADAAREDFQLGQEPPSAKVSHDEAFDAFVGELKTRETERGTAVYSRTGSSVPLPVGDRVSEAAAADEVQQRIERFHHQPPIRIRESALGELPGATVDDRVSGAVHQGAIYLFLDRLADRRDVQRALFHELLHYGLRRFLTREQYEAQMLRLYERDASIRRFADAWAAGKDGDNAHSFGGDSYALARGVDEALALLAEPNAGEYLQRGVLARAYRSVLSWLAELAESLGFRSIAAELRGVKNEEARTLIRSVFTRLESDAPATTDAWGFFADQAFASDAPREVTYTITKVGRKWLEGKQAGKPYTNQIEINDASRDWKVGETVTFQARTEFTQSRYGATVQVFPVSAEQAQAQRAQVADERALADLRRQLGFIEDSAAQGRRYDNGIEKARALGIDRFPAEKARLDAALAKVRAADAVPRAYLNVPYAEKDAAKARGARWDPERRQWYVRGEVPDALRKYLPGQATQQTKQPDGDPAAAGQITLSMGSGYGGRPYAVGETLRNPAHARDAARPEFVTITSASQRYYRYDGMSFGVGDEQGYVYMAKARPATEQEAAPVVERERKAAERRERIRAVDALRLTFTQQGEVPKSADPRGETLLDSFNLYGGGERWVIDRDGGAIWYVRNNGADGDNWAQNNVVTGGAGAIGWRMPWTQQAEQTLRDAAGDAALAVYEPDATYDVAARAGQADNAPYETDLFGAPLPQAAGKNRSARPEGAGVRGNVQPKPAVPGDTQAPPGDYYAPTVVGVVTQRKLGAKRINSPKEAAQATQYLYESAVERFDGIVTDKDGKPLAVVGGFKGALSQTNVYTSTLVGEAVRVPGAARIWFSHNHPSGTAELSRADEHINNLLTDVFAGSGIEPMGMLAIGNNGYGYVGPTQGSNGLRESGAIQAPSDAGVVVPVIERVATRPAQTKPMVGDPAQAKAAATAYYSSGGNQPGLILLDAQHGITAWVPIQSGMTGRLRATGGLNAIYRAVSESNAGAAIIVHGGELDAVVAGGVSASQNIAAALRRLDVRPLDSINAKTGESAAESGRVIDQGPMYSQGAGSRTSLESLRAALRREIGADVIDAIERAGVLTLTERPADAPAGAVGETRGERMWLYPGADVSVAYHEALHAALRRLIGDEAFERLMARMPLLAAGNRKWFADAAERVPAGTPARVRNEELASYAVEQYQRAREAMPAGVRKWVQELIAALKAGLAKALQAAGIGLRLRVKLMGDAAVLHKLARDGLRTMAREERAASHADLVPAFSRTDQSQTPEANALKALSENDELFALPKSKATAVEEIAKDIDPQIKVAAPIKHGLETWYKFTMPDGAVARMVVREPNPYGANVYSATQNEAGDYDWNPVRAGENPDDVPQDKADVWIDVSGLKTGGGGAKIYAIAGDYAHNTGRMFIGDPSGVSDIAMRRRPEQMLSSALRWGTTEHLAPHPDQDKGNSKIGVPPLRWVYGDDIGNINRLIDLNLQALDNAFPGAREVEFDAESGQFRVTESGRVIGREALGRRLDQLRSDSDSAVASAALGGTTLARGLVLRSLLREARGGGAAAGGRDGVLARIARLRSDPESQTHRLFSISDQVADLPPSGVEKVRGRIAAETPAGRRRRAQDLIDAKGGVFDFNRLGETKQDRIRAIVDGARKFWLGAVTRDQIADMYGDEIPPVREYDRLTREMENERAKRAQDADELYNEWAKLPAAVNARLADIMADATINQVHPDREFALPDGVARGSREDILFRLANAERSATHKRLAAEYAALPADAKEMYQRVKGYHEQTLADLRAAIEARLMRQVEDGAARAATLSLIRQKFDKYLGTGPYFPLSRFGDYLVIANNDEVDGDRFVASYGNAGEQQAAARALEAEGYTVKTTVAKAYSRTDDGAATKFIGDVLTAVDKLDFTDADFEDKKADLKGKLLDDINQLFIKALPDISYRKHFQHRKGTPGFSSDMMRGFASSAFHAAAHIARLNHGDKMTFALADAFQTISDAPEGDFGKAAQVLNELLKRHDAMLNPDTHPLSAMLSQLGFVMYLGLSPAAGIVNMLQTVMVTMPHLGARYGFAKANASLAKAYKDILAAPMNGKNGWNAAQSMKLSVSERAMMTQLQDEGVIDLTQAHELAAATTLDTGNVARSKAAFAMSRAMKIFGWTFHVPEVMNRQVTALAAYRMEMQKSGDVAKAKDAAREAIKRTHFDYSASNTSRYMQGNVARVIFQFKKYSQNMTYLLGRALHQALKGETPEVKAIARRQLLATLGVTWAMAGALGLPAVGSVAGLLGLFLSALSDDDEPWDWKTEFRNLMADTFGKEAGEVISHGVPRALMPWDISNRTGLADLWWRSNDRAEQSPREAFASDFTNNILGPTIGGYSLGLYTAADHMAKGHWSKAVESIVPKAMRDPLKALREYNEGVTNYNGEQIMDVNGLEVLGRVIGFAPARASEMYEARNAVKNAEATLDERRSMLLDGMVKARMSGDGQAAGALQAEITQFNQRHPEFRITGDSVIKSLLAKRRALAETEDGYRLSRSRESLRSLGRFANSGPEQ